MKKDIFANGKIVKRLLLIGDNFHVWNCKRVFNNRGTMISCKLLEGEKVFEILLYEKEWMERAKEGDEEKKRLKAQAAFRKTLCRVPDKFLPSPLMAPTSC